MKASSLGLCALVVIGAANAGCVARQQTQFVRLDGKDRFTDPKLRQQYEVDSAVCKGETAKAMLGTAQIHPGTGVIPAIAIQANNEAGLKMVAEGCMAQRGYVSRPVAS